MADQTIGDELVSSCSAKLSFIYLISCCLQLLLFEIGGTRPTLNIWVFFFNLTQFHHVLGRCAHSGLNSLYPINSRLSCLCEFFQALNTIYVSFERMTASLKHLKQNSFVGHQPVKATAR